MAELYAIVDAQRKVKEREQRFAAALQGVKLDDERDGELTGDDIKKRVEAKARGLTDEQIDFGEVGITIIEE